MPLIVNTNLASLNAQRNLTKSQGDLNTALQTATVSNVVPWKYQDNYFFGDGMVHIAPFDLKFCVRQLHYND